MSANLNKTRRASKASAAHPDIAQALASSPRTFAERDHWMRTVLASDLPDAAVRLAMALALDLHVNTSRCNPTFPRLTGASHLSERSTYRLVDLLEHRGWIAVTRFSGKGNHYALLTPDKVLAGVADPTPDTVLSGDHCQSSDRGTPDKAMAGDPCQQVAAHKKRAKRAKKEREESVSLRHVSPDVAARDSRRKSLPTEESSAQPCHNRSAEIAARFEEFWRAYPRKAAKLAAERAFAKALERGVGAETLISGAKAYAVLRAGQDPKYTKHPATWLNGGCWDDEPSGTPVIDEAGNVVTVEQQSPVVRSGFTAIADLLIAQIEEEGASW